MKEALTKKVDAAKEKMKNLLKGAADTAKKAASALSSGAKTAANKLSSGLKSLSSGLKDKYDQYKENKSIDTYYKAVADLEKKQNEVQKLGSRRNSVSSLAA
jgi:2-oxo-4-hydroxy-4-carboxy--5-ureidoimidazoline (OHCU) decarboxylase